MSSKDKCGCNHCHNSLCIYKVPIFSSLDSDDLEKIASLIVHKEYKKGEFILRAGDRLDGIIIMNTGSAKALKYTGEGREQILYVFLEGDFFGEQYLLSNEISTYSVEALTPVKVCMLMKEQFKELLYQYPKIGVKVIEELGSRLTRLESTLQSMGVRSVDARIASLLLEYSKKYGKVVEEGELISLPLSREGIANYLGIARETLSRKLSSLENDGIIRTINNKSILITNKEELMQFAGVDEFTS